MKGNPNDESMKNHFIAKVWDPVDQEYKPLYILPDATDEIKGGVYLTNELTGDSAATGVTAMTPQGVNAALDELIRVDWHEPDAEIYSNCKLWIQPPPPPINYALIIDSTNSDPEKAVTYIGDLEGHESGWDAWKNDRLFNEIKPCVLKDGKVQYYLQKDDYTKKEDGSPSNLSGSDGDVMVQIPLLGYYLHYEDDILHVELTNEPNKENFCYYAHSLDDVGDCDYIYIGAYLLSGSSSTVNTVSGQNPRVSTTMTNFRIYVQSKGDGNQLLSWYVWNLMQVLYLIVYKNLNSQSALGMGYVTSNSAVTTTGQTDSTGFCSNAENNTTDGKHQVKCLGIEDFWGNAYQWCDGIYCDSSYNILTDYKNFHNTGSGYQFSEPSGFTNSGSSYIKKAAGNNNRAFLPINSSNGLTEGSTSTYFCDYCYVYSGYAAGVGGYCSDGSVAGAFCCNLGYHASYSGSFLGAREVYKHKAV